MRVLTEHLETTHTRSQKEASNISQIETLHPFNFLNELGFFYTKTWTLKTVHMTYA